MAIANVQKPANPSTNELEVNSATASNSQALAYNANVVSGNFLVLLISWGDVNALATTNPVTDTQGNTWLLAKLQQGNGNSAACYYCNALSSAANTVTVKWQNSTVAFPGLYLYEFSGLPSGTTDGTNGGTGASSATFTTGNITTVNANDLLMGLAVTGGTVTVGTSGYTFLATNLFHNGAEYQIVSATGTYSGTMTGSSATTYASLVVAFQAVSNVLPAPKAVSTSRAAVTVRLAGPIVPATCSYADVAAAVNAAPPGWTLTIPPGIAFWNQTIIVRNPIAIVGQGVILKRSPGFLGPFFSGTGWNQPIYTVTGIMFDNVQVGSDRIGRIYPGKDFGQPFCGQLIDVWHGPLYKIMLPDVDHTWPKPAPISYPSPDPPPYPFR